LDRSSYFVEKNSGICYKNTGHTLMLGKKISHYRIIERIGEGGMGVIYLAEDIRLQREVALKFLPPDLTRDPAARERLIREAQVASALDHPAICTVFEIDQTPDEQMYIAMAYYPGQTLKQKIERGGITYEQALDLTIEIAKGLEKALKVLDQLTRISEDTFVSPFSLAIIHLGLGDNEKAIPYLEKAFAEKMYHMLLLKTDPRIKKLLLKLGFSENHSD